MKAPLDRRAFLTSTGMALAATAGPMFMGDPRSARAGELTGRLKKAAGLNMVQGNLSLEDKLRLLKDVGFDGVEAPTHWRAPNLDPKALARASEKVGLPVHGVVHAGHPNLTDAIDEASMLGATSVLCVAPADRQGSYQANYRRTQATIRRAADHAEKKQVYLLVENVWATFLIEPLTMARYLDELDSPYVKSYFDIGNCVRWGWPHQWIEVLGKRVIKLHAKEYNLDVAMKHGMLKAFNCPMGKGSIDWAKVRKQLLAVDYHGWVTAEVRGGDRRRLAEIAQQVDQVLGL